MLTLHPGIDHAFNHASLT